MGFEKNVLKVLTILGYILFYFLGGKPPGRTFQDGRFDGNRFDLSGDKRIEYQPNVAGTTVSIEPYIRCTYGLATIEYNTSTREIKAGISIATDSKPGNLCDIGVKEKVTKIQVTNDPVFIQSK